MAIKISITGGIGSGKSVMLMAARNDGCSGVYFRCGSQAANAYDEVVRRELSALVGEDVYQGGQLNHPLLASYMFGYPQRMEKINRIVHPQVKADFRRWVAEHSHADWVAMESAIVIEAGFRRK